MYIINTCTSYVYNKHAWVMYIINTCTSYVYNKHAWCTCTSYVYNKHAWTHALVMYIINMHEHMH